MCEASPKTTSMSCSTRRMVRPPAAESLRISPRTRSRSPDPMPAVGSSRKRSRGRVASASAISSKRRSPWESSAAGRSLPCPRPTSSSSVCARERRSWSAARRRTGSRARFSMARSGTATFSSEVRSGKTLVTWKVRAMPHRTRALAARSVTSAPSSRTRPSSGISFPVRRLRKVVLPAPLGPMSAVIPPSGSERSTPATATKSANDLRSPRTSRSALMLPCG